jgi:hypothetical protein
MGAISSPIVKRMLKDENVLDMKAKKMFNVIKLSKQANGTHTQ